MNKKDDMPEEVALQKILNALGIEDLNINSRGLFEGYIREAMNTRPTVANSEALEGVFRYLLKVGYNYGWPRS